VKRSMIVVAVCVAAVSMFVAGCKSNNSPVSQAPNPAQVPAVVPTSAAAAVKDVTPGNCTIYTKDDAVKLLGGVNMNNKALDINTGGGQKIDVCSYINLKGMQDIEGLSYAVVKYDSAATAFAQAQKVQTEMLGDANEHQWAVDSLTTAAPNAGQVLGGTGTKTDQGVTYTIAVVGTNVGPYLVAALGASSESAGNAKNFALTTFQALAAGVS